MEKWRPVSGYEGLYSVSNLGRVRSEDRAVAGKGGAKRWIKGRVLVPGIYAGSRPHVNLYENGRGKSHYVCRLVAEAFLPPLPGPDFAVVYKNGDPNDNRASNLKWGALGETQNPFFSSEDIKAIRLLSQGGHTDAYIARLFGVWESRIAKVVSGKSYAWVADARD